eukprot:4927514-Pyramimonas_sp.AAC.1
MQDMTSKRYHMGKAGYVVGAMVKLRKDVQDTCPLWRIASISEETATLEPTGCWASDVKSVNLDDFKKEWAVTNQKPQREVSFHCDLPENHD